MTATEIGKERLNAGGIFWNCALTTEDSQDLETRVNTIRAPVLVHRGHPLHYTLCM